MRGEFWVMSGEDSLFAIIQFYLLINHICINTTTLVYQYYFPINISTCIPIHLFYINPTCIKLSLFLLINYFPIPKQSTLFNILLYNSPNKSKMKHKSPNFKGKCLLLIDDLILPHIQIPLNNKVSQIASVRLWCHLRYQNHHT